MAAALDHGRPLLLRGRGARQGGQGEEGLESGVGLLADALDVHQFLGPLETAVLLASLALLSTYCVCDRSNSFVKGI